MYSSTRSQRRTLNGVMWSASHPGRFISEERCNGTHLIESWMDPLMRFRGGKKLLTFPGIEPQIVGRAAHSLVTVPPELSGPLLHRSLTSLPSPSTLPLEHFPEHRIILLFLNLLRCSTSVQNFLNYLLSSFLGNPQF